MINAPVKGSESAEQRPAIKKSKGNSVGNLLLLFGGGLFITSIFVSLFYNRDFYPNIFLGLMVAGLGEAINLLQKIEGRKRHE
ncbi:hypothetical protein HGI30_15155 [Paenibacillus albicereus]|uniref:Uncharacterized protein n=1 Tax=Paenibacillus albicereus TaxID=2726185 RepID=A0A6H2GZC7_9BACL|nr:hypothetical protein [Paenibacillus albicereus]QJC52770.1 hypothetical protein HGI30_15155 [Paenibacillus albicereus]